MTFPIWGCTGFDGVVDTEKAGGVVDSRWPP